MRCSTPLKFLNRFSHRIRRRAASQSSRKTRQNIFDIMQTAQKNIVARRQNFFLPVRTANQISSAQKQTFFQFFFDAENKTIFAFKPFAQLAVISSSAFKIADIFRRLIHKQTMFCGGVIAKKDRIGPYDSA